MSAKGELSRGLIDGLIEKVVAKVFADESIFLRKTNVLAWDSNGSALTEVIKSNQSLFVSETAISPDGNYLYLLTSAHIQRAVAGLDQEVCSIYRVKVSDQSFSCLLSTELGDIEPKSLIPSQQTDYARSGIQFRADGAAVLQGFDSTRVLPDGVDGGTNSTIAWFMTPEGVLTPIPVEDTHFVFGVVWLTDDYIAVAENPVYRRDDSRGEGTERLTVIRASDLSVVKQIEAQNICCGPIAKVGTNIFWQYGLGFDGKTLDFLTDQIEGIPFVDDSGERLYVYPDYLETENLLQSADGQVSLDLTDGDAQAPNWRKQSGTGTDVKYTGFDFKDDLIAYIKSFESPEKIVEIAGQKFDRDTTYDLGASVGSVEIQAFKNIFIVKPSTSLLGDFVINYVVDRAGERQDRQLVIAEEIIANWRIDSSSNGESFEWASPEPDQEGFCVYRISTGVERCHQFLDYRVLSTDLEYFRRDRWDGQAVYPNGNAFPGVQTILFTGSDVRVYFKDSIDHSYYEAAGSAQRFLNEGISALQITKSVNGAGDANIIGLATQLAPPAARIAAIESITRTVSDSGAVTLNVEMPFAISSYAKLPGFVVTLGGEVVQIAETKWSQDWSTVSLLVSDYSETGDFSVALSEAVFAANGTRLYSFPNATSIPLNRIPTIPSSGTITIAENSTDISLAISDLDDDNFSVKLSGADSSLFIYDLQAGTLSFISAPDYEDPVDANGDGIYEVTVTAEDALSTSDESLRVAVTDGSSDGTGTTTGSGSDSGEGTDSGSGAGSGDSGNQLPVITGLNPSLAVDENSLNVVQVTASDPDGDPVYYSVTGADKALFTISGSGLLAFVSAPDYETPQDADGNNVYEIAIEVSDAAPVSEKPGAKLKARRVQRNKVSAALSVSVNNIDEDLIAFSFTTTDGTATEAPTLSVALTIDALTQASEVQVLTWKIGGEQTWRTATRVDSLNWTISVSLDDSAASGTYEVRSVRIIRDGLSELSFTDTALKEKAFTITSDLYNTRSDSTPPTLTKIESITVSGNDSDVGTPIKVEIVATVDDGVGRLDKAFSYIKAPGGAITGAWAVLNDAGTEATFSFALDAKAGAGSYQIDDVRLYDAAGNEKFYNQTDLSNAGFTDTWSINNSIADNTAPAITDLYLIPSLDADDLNRKQITVYLTTDAPESALRNAYIRLISPSNANIDKYLLDLGRPFTTVVDGNQYALTISLPIEYPDGTYNIAYIFVDDAALNKRTYQVAELNGLEFNTNVVFGSGNDHAPDISSGSSFVVVENVATIGTVSATDYDSDSLGYALAGTDAAALMINGSGVLSFVSAADFEVQSSYAVSVAVSDGTNTSTQDLTITVTDVDESPVVTSSLNLSASENQTAIGTIAARDAEGAAVTFSLSGDDAASFSISPAGVLSFVAAPNYESQSAYNVTVTVSDGTNASSSDLTIAVTNVNEAPTMTSAAQASVAENTTAVITFTSTDPDGDVLSYALSGKDAALFNVDASSAGLSFKAAPDFETPSDADGDNIYLITVTGSDGNGASITQDLVITVIDVNETVTGVLIDGYLAGATVFQDLNNNGAPDSGEPQTTTDILGNFTLTLQSASPDARVRVVNTGFDIGANDVLGAMLDISPRTSGKYIMTPLSTLAARMMSFDEDMTKAVAEQVVADAVGVDLANAPNGCFVWL